MSKVDGKQNILLESGTNELEVLVFIIAGQMYGINVAKVREIINLPRILQLPEAHKAVDGIFELRGKVIPLVSIRTLFNLPPNENAKADRVVVCEFNEQQFAFRVDEIRRIHRISWSDVGSPEEIVALADEPPPITGVIKLQNQVIQMLDFENVMNDLQPGLDTRGAVIHANPRLASARVMIADDSLIVRRKIEHLLREMGVGEISDYGDGKALWEALEARAQEARNAGKPLSEYVNLVITDIEMPQMDGHHLTKSIKERPDLKTLPVIIYSSLITPELLHKGTAVGADFQIVKSDTERMIKTVNALFNR